MILLIFPIFGVSKTFRADNIVLLEKERERGYRYIDKYLEIDLNQIQ